jgi:outer membrane protein, multidrug efflux system
MTHKKALWAAIITAVSLSGCAIKPQPISENERLKSIMADQSEMYSKQEAIKGPLTFYDALARALKYNFDHRLTIMEAVLQDTQLSVATIQMLPKLTASAGYDARDGQLYSTSQLLDGRDTRSVTPATSQDKRRGFADLTFAWNVLDFGVSYYQAKQQADRVLIAQERQRKVVNNLIKEMMQAYWSASIAERLLPRLEPVLAQAERALELSHTIEDSRLQPIVGVLEYQRSLLRIIDQLKKLKSDLLVAKPKLAGLINAPRGSDFTLADPDQTPEPPEFNVPVAQLEELGLFHRPELREEMYQERISRADAWKEILKIMPGINIPLSVNWDSNSFLLNQLWLDAGVRTTFNLVNLIAAPKIWESAQTQIEVAKTRRKALTVAALVQINVGYQQYAKALESYKSSKELSKVDEGIFTAVSNNADNDAGSELERIHAATSALASQLEKEQSLSEVYAALGNIYSSIGLNPANVNIENVSVKALSNTLKNNIDLWYKGKLPALPKLATVQPVKLSRK